MTLVDADTGEVVAEMTPDAARLLTDRIKVAVEVTWHLVTEAYQSRAWSALGYTSWDDYCTREFGTSRLRLPREERQDVVASLRESGLSTRAIAAATGIDRKTIRRDLDQVGEMGPPEPTEAGSVAPAASPAPAPRPVVGTDGKTYPAPAPRAPEPRPEPTKPRRSPLVEQVRTAGWELRKAVERMQRIADDDRFPANKEQVAAQWVGHLTNAVEVCQDLLDGLTTEPPMTLHTLAPTPMYDAGDVVLVTSDIAAAIAFLERDQLADEAERYCREAADHGQGGAAS